MLRNKAAAEEESASAIAFPACGRRVLSTRERLYSHGWL
jgi:hypothetical protein